MVAYNSNQFWAKIRQSKCCVTALLFVRVAVVLTAYFVSGVGLTLFNKWFLSEDGFEYPITLMMCQSFLNFFWASCVIFLCMRSTLSQSEYWISKLSWREYVTKFVPLGICFATDIVATNSAMVYASVSFVSIIKTGIPILVLFAGFIFGKAVISLLKVAIILLLSFGICLTAWSETTFSTTGLLLALLGVCAGATKLILMENVLTGSKKIHPILMMFYFTPVAGASLAAPFSFYDEKLLEKSLWFDEMHYEWTVGFIVLGAAIAFILNMSEFFIIEQTSALTLCVCGVAKLIVVIIVSIILFNHEVNDINVIGIVITVLGVIFYNVHRYTQGENNRRTSSNAIENSVHLSDSSTSSQTHRNDTNGTIEFMPLSNREPDGGGDSDSDIFDVPSDLDDLDDPEREPLQEQSAFV